VLLLFENKCVDRLLKTQRKRIVKMNTSKFIGIAADHGGYALKESLVPVLRAAGYEVIDFGAHALDNDDDFPDYVGPLSKAVANGDVARGLAICGSGVGACIVANKIRGVRAALISDTFSAHQGVEDDDMNVMCLGSRVIGTALATELVHTFLNAKFKGIERFLRRLEKVTAIEKERFKK
jgi:ribose 5-phosphate isomerase B